MQYSGINTLTEMIVKTKEYVDKMVSGLYRPAGSVAFASLPALSTNVLGNVYNITDNQFTTTADFVEGAGHVYYRGTNVVVVDQGTVSSPDLKFDVLPGIYDFSAYVVATPDANGYPDVATPDVKVIYIVPTANGTNLFYYNGTNFIKISNDYKEIQKETLPTAGSDELGAIYQFIGTTGTYTHGYFYECVEDSSTTPSTYSWEEVEVQAGGSGGSTFTQDITASIAVGGISVGREFKVGDSYEDFVIQLIDPVQNPTLTNPSASISGGTTLLETGSSVSRTLTVSFNRGSINPAYGTSGYRSGAAVDYSLNGGTAQSGNTFTQTVSESNKTFKAKVNYSAGEQPKNSKGGNYSTPLPAGYVETSTLTYSFVDAMWANTAAIGTIAKLSLVAKSSGQRDLVFPAQTVANPEVFDIPASWTVSAVQVKNDLSGAYEDASAQFTVTNTTHNNAAGTSVAYKRYTFNLGYPTGSRTVRVKFS